MPDNCNLLQQQLLEIKNNLALLQSQSDAFVVNGDPNSASEIKDNLKQMKMKKEVFMEHYKTAVINLFDKLFRIPYAHHHNTTKVEINDNGRVTYRGNYDNIAFSDYLKYLPSLVSKVTGNVYLKDVQQMAGVEVIDGWLGVSAENFEAPKLKEINGKSWLVSKAIDITVAGKASFPALLKIQCVDVGTKYTIEADTLEIPQLEYLDCHIDLKTIANLVLPRLKASETTFINAPLVDAPLWEEGTHFEFGDTCEVANLPALKTCDSFSCRKIKKIDLNVETIDNLVADEATDITLSNAMDIKFIKAPLATTVETPKLVSIHGTLSTPLAQMYTCPLLTTIGRSLDMSGYQGSFREAFPVLESVGMRETTAPATIRVNSSEQKSEIEALVSQGEFKFSGQIVVV